MADIIQLRRDTAANWVTANPVLADGEIGIETDTKKRKCGNGTTAWNSLSYMFSDDLDQEPTANSHKPVESGGVKSAIDTVADLVLTVLDTIGEAEDIPVNTTNLIRSSAVYPYAVDYDITAAKEKSYRSLLEALQDVPVSNKRGGMSLRFLNSFTGKYEQWKYLLSSTSSANFMNTSNWQGLDDEPTENSQNLVKSGGVRSAIQTSTDVALSALDTIANADDFPTEDSQELVRSGGVYAAIVAIANMILSVSNRFPQTQNGGFHIVDSDNNIGMRYDENGLDFAAIASHAISLLIDSGIAGYDYVSEEIARLEAMIGGGGGGHDSHIELTAENGMYFVDENLNIGAYLDENGFHAKNIIEYEIINQ